VNQPTALDSLAGLAKMLNCALEHVPAETRSVLLSISNQHMKVLEQALTPKPEPQKPPTAP
jgi:hypothetical protein